MPVSPHRMLQVRQTPRLVVCRVQQPLSERTDIWGWHSVLHILRLRHRQIWAVATHPARTGQQQVLRVLERIKVKVFAGQWRLHLDVAGTTGNHRSRMLERQWSGFLHESGCSFGAVCFERAVYYRDSCCGLRAETATEKTSTRSRLDLHRPCNN